MTTLGSVTLSIYRFSGWDYPDFGTTVPILSDGTSVRNEVIQSGASPRRRASLSGALVSASDIATLRGYNLSKEALTFDEQNGDESDGETLIVHVLGFRADRDRQHPWLWEYDMTLVEGEPDESSS